MSESSAILFCHCTYARVVDPGVRDGVLRALCESDLSFEAVADLCEMSARKDPALRRLVAAGRLKIAACHPRAVKGLFAAAEASLPVDSAEIINMREAPMEACRRRILDPNLCPNLPGARPGPETSGAGSERREPHS